MLQTHGVVPVSCLPPLIVREVWWQVRFFRQSFIADDYECVQLQLLADKDGDLTQQQLRTAAMSWLACSPTSVRGMCVFVERGIHAFFMWSSNDSADRHGFMSRPCLVGLVSVHRGVSESSSHLFRAINDHPFSACAWPLQQHHLTHPLCSTHHILLVCVGTISVHTLKRGLALDLTCRTHEIRGVTRPGSQNDNISVVLWRDTKAPAVHPMFPFANNDVFVGTIHRRRPEQPNRNLPLPQQYLLHPSTDPSTLWRVLLYSSDGAHASVNTEWLSLIWTGGGIAPGGSPPVLQVLMSAAATRLSCTTSHLGHLRLPHATAGITIIMLWNRQQHEAPPLPPLPPLFAAGDTVGDVIFGLAQEEPDTTCILGPDNQEPFPWIDTLLCQVVLAMESAGDDTPVSLQAGVAPPLNVVSHQLQQS